MIKGFYAAVSGMLLNANRQNVLSHNIANMNTPGFKQVLTNAETFYKTQVVYSPNNLDGSFVQRNIGELGLGTAIGREQIDFTDGGFQMTDSPLDFAIQGQGFFTLQTPQGERYTRDGRFIRNADGGLVSIEGFPLLDTAGQPVVLPEGTVSLATDGTLSVNGAQVAQLGIAAFANPEADLVRDSGNLFVAQQAPQQAVGVQLRQSFLEASNANPTNLMASLVEVGRSYEASQQMVSNQDELLGKTISSLGRLG
jgi:flagellar basal body rod protein FlgG